MIPTFVDIVFVGVIYLFLMYQYKNVNNSLIFNPLSPPILIFAISVVTVNYFYRIGNMNENIYFILIIEFLIYFLFLFITPHLIRKKYLKLSNYMNIKNFDLQLTKIVFFASLVIGLIYIILFWTTYSSGSDRFIFNRQMRELMLLNNVFSIWALSMSSLIYSKTKENRYLFYVITLIILSAFTGARSAPIVNLLLFLFFYFQCNIINLKKMISLGLVSFFILMIPTYLMYEQNAFEMILNRVFQSADIYLWSFEIGDYTKFINYYDPISYLLHPFSSIFGVRGYDYGFGAQILETAGLVVNGTGPNDQMPMLGLIFYDDCFLCIILFMLFFSFIMMSSFLFIYYFFSKMRISLTLRTVIFSLLFSSSIYIFIGVNAFSFNIIISIIAIIIYFIFDFLKIVSISNKEKN